MSRKSTRSTKQKKECDEEIESTLSKKRKAEKEPEMEENLEVKRRRQQFQLQNQWVPISQQQAVTSCTIIPSPEVLSPHRCTPKDSIMGSCSTFRFQNHFTTPIEQRLSPLPKFAWADSKEVWRLMLKKEQLYKRDEHLLEKHPALLPRMRSILLDWIIEVCEVYRLHRETYHLAMDFVDRYLAATSNVQKQELQLLGITSLFVAAKLEEIYPPKLTEFAYVTDGACTENEILVQELVILKALKWDLAPMTVNSWLNVYLQLVNLENIEAKQDTFVYPQYSQHAFIQIARLLDLCTLDVACLQFTYSVLATSALYHMSSEHVALSVSGFQWIDIAPCVQWMAPFAISLREAGPVELKFFKGVSAENTHNIQTHEVDLRLLENSQTRQTQVYSALSRASPDITKEIPGIITPPQSREKEKEGNQSPVEPLKPLLPESS